MPFLDNLLDKNPIVRIGPRKFENVVVTTSGHMAARKQGLDKNLNPSQPDYLQLLLDSQAESPDTVTDGIIVTIIIGNLVAGADTTAIAINSALYFAIRDRRIRQKLSDEIFSAGLDGQGVVSYSKVRGLPCKLNSAVVRHQHPTPNTQELPFLLRFPQVYISNWL